MRRFTFSWVIIVIAIMFAFLMMLSNPTITGRSILDSADTYTVPTYLTTFIVMTIILVFFILFAVGFGVHLNKNRIKEEESIKELIDKIK